jgi:RNA polymerase sporulation-specific sigma factor
MEARCHPKERTEPLSTRTWPLKPTSRRRLHLSLRDRRLAEMFVNLKLRSQLSFYRLLFWLGWKSEEVYYIGGSEALPPPLSREEEEYLLERLSTGDAAIRAMLIERNLRLVVYIARKFENTGIHIEDLVSIGAIGLIKAVNTFDPDKKIKLATYASRCIENEILMYLRRNSKTRTEVSFDEPLNIDWDGNELLLSDVLGTENDTIYRNIEEQVDRKLLHKALDKLSERERTIMELRFGLADGEEKTQKDVADLLGISQSYISRLEKRIIKRLRKEFNKMV